MHYRNLREAKKNKSMKTTSGIYSITNAVNGKKYYGSSINVWQRQRQHWHALRKRKHRNPHLQAAWNLYGEAAFVFAVVEQLPEDELAAAEQRYLDQNVGGYNIGKFADAPARGRKKTPEAIAKMSAARRGKPLSDAHKIALSVAGKGRKASPATRAKLSAANTGKKHSNATKAKLSVATGTRWQDESYRETTIAAQRAAHSLPEVKAICSGAMAARWADPEQRNKLSAERKARWADPEYRAKMLAIRREQGKLYSGENWRDRPKQKERSNACA